MFGPRANADPTEDDMASEVNDTVQERTIHWQSDVDAALNEARDSDCPLLLDFTNAPK